MSKMRKIMEDAVGRQVGGAIGTQKVLTELAAYERECLDDLLHGLPPEGGTVSKAVFERVLSMAFMSGVLNAANTITPSEI